MLLFCEVLYLPSGIERIMVKVSAGVAIAGLVSISEVTLVVVVVWQLVKYSFRFPVVNAIASFQNRSIIAASSAVAYILS